MDKGRLEKDFFKRNAIDVAKDLLGKTLVFKQFQGVITETEAYRGSDDPASHAFKGPTPRALIMFGEPGVSYIYLVYGMYHCLNIVTEDKGSPSAVLIRSIDFQAPQSVCMNGPGKLCRYMAMTRDQNGVDLTTDKDFYIKEGLLIPHQIGVTPRIGIKVGQEKLWRFIIINPNSGLKVR